MKTTKTTTPTDAALLEAWRAGDVRAGDELLCRHYAGLRRFFGRRLEHEHEDLIQATFLACIERIPQFRAEASFRTLLYAIAWRQLCRHIRDRRPADGFESSRVRPRTGPSLGSAMAMLQEWDRLEEALYVLKDDDRRMLVLHYWQTMSIAEIAIVFDRPRATIKVQMHRARAQLREALRQA